jgi:hypothetical protein
METSPPPQWQWSKENRNMPPLTGLGKEVVAVIYKDAAPPALEGKAPEDWRTPGRFANIPRPGDCANILECGGPPPLFKTLRERLKRVRFTLGLSPAVQISRPFGTLVIYRPRTRR